MTEYRCVWPYGTLWYIECSSNRIAQDVWTQHISPTTIRAPTNLQSYLKDRLSQVSVQWGYCLFWMMHTTLSITQLYESPIRANKTPYCQETTQPIGVPSHTTMEMYVLITMTPHFSNIFLVGLWYEPSFVRFAKYSPFDFTALSSDAFAVSV